MINAVGSLRRRLLLLAAAAGGYLWFYMLEQAGGAPGHIMFIPLDSYIPFIPEFVVFYISWYIYLLVPAVLLFLRDEGEFLRYGAFLTGALYMACLVYTLWPNGIELRADLSAATGPFNALVRLLYELDTPTNSAPSLHAAQSVAAHVAIVRLAAKRRRSRVIGVLSMALCVLILLSTVYIKQHSIADMLWGLLLAGVLGTVIYGGGSLKRRISGDRKLQRAAAGSSVDGA
ncbi:MAG: phosphatase PAP2 family protein [Oscillospiraceae bacterium]|jgi:membrane-associated phospholipid phosphatase|nr:phosphatase PAP2 family protein [Oscillospiraceae bacterium]